jgi:hypothetical protein
MTCETVRIGGAVAIVCSRGRRRKRCACGRPATKLCDALRGASGEVSASPQARDRRATRTCDAPLCGRCAVPAGPDRDLCPTHSAAKEPSR